MDHPVNYFEIGSSDPQGSAAFYGGLFGWTFEKPQGPAPYWMVDEARGGLWDTSEIGREHWAIFYVQVDDVTAAVEDAVGLGASVTVPVTDNGNIDFAHLIDPQGNRFGVWHPHG
jgi:predicted enzyme related to lactoylglutathione lyase